MEDIERRIAMILRGAGVCEAEPSRGYTIGCSPEYAASALVTELGLTEFTCDNERWWATKIEPLGRADLNPTEGKHE